jgi:hypothetical protein
LHEKTASCLAAALTVLFVAAPLLDGEENQPSVQQQLQGAARRMREKCSITFLIDKGG